MVGASVGRTLLSAAFDVDFAGLSLGPTFKSKSKSKAADKSVRPTHLGFRIACMRPVFEWQIGSRAVQLGKRTLIMGVVNVTPDSFSDGGVNFDRDRAVEYALKLLHDGADIVDVGGESTRPGANVVSTGDAVTEKEELERVIPVISAIKQKNPQAIVSVDTYKAGVARAAVKAGAEIVNDVSGFLWDPQMRKTLAELKCGAVMMHMRGRPTGMEDPAAVIGRGDRW